MIGLLAHLSFRRPKFEFSSRYAPTKNEAVTLADKYENTHTLLGRV